MAGLACDVRAALGNRAITCGSLRRLRPAVGDADMVLDGLSTDDATGLLLPLGWAVADPRDGPRTRLVRTEAPMRGLSLDLWEPERPADVGVLVLHATGSGPHNTLMRRWARVMHGLSLTWRGLVDADGNRLDDGTEGDPARILGWPTLEPHEREVDLLDPPAWLRPLLRRMDEVG